MTNNLWFPEGTLLSLLHALENAVPVPWEHPSQPFLPCSLRVITRRYSSGRCYPLKGAFPESRLCPFHVPPWATSIHPSEHRLHCLVAANRSFCLLENTALIPRQEGPFPPHSHLTWVLYLKGLSAGPPLSPFSMKQQVREAKGMFPAGAQVFLPVPHTLRNQDPKFQNSLPHMTQSLLRRPGLLSQVYPPEGEPCPRDYTVGHEGWGAMTAGCLSMCVGQGCWGQRRCRARGQEPAHAVPDTEEPEIPKSKALPTQVPLRNWKQWRLWGEVCVGSSCPI